MALDQPEQQKWMTVGEVAKILGVTTETVRNKIKRFELPASRASDAPRAAFLIDAAAFERQRAADVELAAVRKRLGGAGVIVGYGTDVPEQLDERFPGSGLAEQARDLSTRSDLFERLQAEMAADPAVQSRLRELDDAERFEAKAQELARRVREEEALRARALEILEDEAD